MISDHRYEMVSLTYLYFLARCKRQIVTNLTVIASPTGKLQDEDKLNVLDIYIQSTIPHDTGQCNNEFLPSNANITVYPTNKGSDYSDSTPTRRMPFNTAKTC